MVMSRRKSEGFDIGIPGGAGREVNKRSAGPAGMNKAVKCMSEGSA
jgi:hypothetical protein